MIANSSVYIDYECAYHAPTYDNLIYGNCEISPNGLNAVALTNKKLVYYNLSNENVLNISNFEFSEPNNRGKPLGLTFYSNTLFFVGHMNEGLFYYAIDS